MNTSTQDKQKKIEQISSVFITAIHKGEETVKKKDDLVALINNHFMIKALEDSDEFTEDDKLKLIQLVEVEITYVKEKSASLSKDHEPWLYEKKREMESNKQPLSFWERYKVHLKYEKLSYSVIKNIDEETDEILDFCGNPAKKGRWRKKGLVVGHVQSGKTTNYSGLINKGIDTGYKIFIIFAGLTNTLRNQTQERIENSVVGISSFTEDLEGVGKIKDLKDIPNMLTGYVSDFNVKTSKTIINLNSGKYIFVLKKNVSTINSLVKWIKKSHPTQSIISPLMLIDDEADNASINTSSKPDQITKINAGIRKILALFDKAAYIGYTATPFANIFIDHESDESLRESERLSEDLFPSNFIVTLAAPNNYCGSRRFFSDINSSDSLNECVTIVDDYTDILDLKHKKDIAETLDVLPDSLYHAIRIFVLFCTVQKLRGSDNKNMSMMINVSRFNDVQLAVQNLVLEYMDKLLNSLAVSDKKNPHILDLKSSFENSFQKGSGEHEYEIYIEPETPYHQSLKNQGFDYSFDDIYKHLYDTVKPISVKLINNRSGDSLDYNNKKEFQKVIAIGGLALSRGLTLEGLAVTYLLRNAGAYDTLMQMARWFGYRPNYERLTRLYLPEISKNHYVSVHEAIEELRTELKDMMLMNKTPLEFGLRVRNSETGIKITAANKSKTGVVIEYAKHFQFKHIQGHILHTDENIRIANWEKTIEFIKELGNSKELKNKIWNANGETVFRFLKSLSMSEFHPDLGRGTFGDNSQSLIEEYIFDRLNTELSEWDVVLPQNGEQECNEFLPHTTNKIYANERNGAAPYKNGYFKVSGDRNAVASGTDIEIGLDKKILLDKIEEAKAENKDQKYYKNKLVTEVRGKPLLIIHLIACSAAKKTNNPVEIDGFSGTDFRFYSSISILLNKTDQDPHPHSYKINKVMQLLGQTEDEIFAEEDEDSLD